MYVAQVHEPLVWAHTASSRMEREHDWDSRVYRPSRTYAIKVCRENRSLVGGSLLHVSVNHGWTGSAISPLSSLLSVHDSVRGALLPPILNTLPDPSRILTIHGPSTKTPRYTMAHHPRLSAETSRILMTRKPLKCKECFVRSQNGRTSSIVDRGTRR